MNRRSFLKYVCGTIASVLVSFGIHYEPVKQAAEEHAKLEPLSWKGWYNDNPRDPTLTSYSENRVDPSGYFPLYGVPSKHIKTMSAQEYKIGEG
jgi:hypothetical protein